ncbi:MaoC family dehydratase [Nocardioides sp.]|uniref:MaoC family dehydratase n=1 Tax=Nocardioides sp. TaxID=35761 RepID=UPI002B805C51|nr:MaoC/PaaZ C-terminal domain-containing protein [Nocardioides sp.]HSX69137.1 MaoC/PaaZ C-terminal domain-containing protein [Nocardioides sp.]
MGETRVVSGTSGAGAMLKAVLPTVPGVNQLPGVKKTSKELPDLVLRREAVEITRASVAPYAAIAGFPAKDVAPLPYVHNLAFPLHMALLTDQTFPFAAMGLVHLENSISQLRPIAFGEKVDVDVRAANLRKSTKGKAFDMLTTVRVGGETVWEETSTYLRVGGGDKENGDAGMALADVDATGAIWSLPTDLGRRYAAVSGDHNPIHLYPLTAKALGFKGHIAHGMWTLSKAAATLEARMPDAVRLDVAFKTPIFLPGKVRFGAVPVDGGLDFAVANPKTGAPHVLGRTRAL